MKSESNRGFPSLCQHRTSAQFPTMKTLHHFSVLVFSVLLLVDPGFSIKISKRKDCMRARGRCFPFICPWPLGYYIGECFWPIRRCCMF
ncbi:---NA--- [Podarcis lilfordi]|uniref:---NA n=1 Tax=Podarcis lilfordi TaxID=74358 RepID=A0AA35K445_9SAUR|nr:---NA--- [Podarcis lilfordi]